MFAFICATFSMTNGTAQRDNIAGTIDSYVTPYVRTNNFAGTVLVVKNGKTVFEKAYGFADRERKSSNTPKTRFHIASISMQFTAATIMRLVDQGSVKLDDSVGAFLPNVAGADKITIRDLLTQRSGLADINDLPDYNEILQHHQTPATLVAKVDGQPLLFAPGSKYLHEEHSAYNLLALIVEKKTGLPFAAAVRQLVFQPLGLSDSFVDDDSAATAANQARGYQPVEVDGLAPAPVIHWSGKTGNASVCTTARDEAQWVHAFVQGQFLSTSSRDAVLDTSQRVGYGWMKGTNKQFDRTAYYMNGRAPGFASFVLHLPKEELTVVLFSNVYSSATTTMGYDITSIALGLSYKPFDPGASLSAEALTASSGTFQFGPDFYQKNAKLALAPAGSALSLRWPSGDISPLIPLSKDHFVDRSYWEDVGIERNASGDPDVLMYGQFRGNAVKR